MSTIVEVSDSARAGVRALIARIDGQLARLATAAAPPAAPTTGEGNGNVNELRASFAVLLKLLAVEPPPELRECPVCKHSGMREATRCGHCWTKLSPLAAVAHPLLEEPRSDSAVTDWESEGGSLLVVAKSTRPPVTMGRTDSESEVRYVNGERWIPAHQG